MLNNNIDTSPNHVQEKILAWETRIKSYKETEPERGKGYDEIHVRYECNKPTKEHVPFTEGDLVLLRHSEITVPPDKPSPWWYGPFTIKSIRQEGIATLSSQFGGGKIASVDRLRHYYHDSEDHNYMGYVISINEVT